MKWKKIFVERSEEGLEDGIGDSEEIGIQDLDNLILNIVDDELIEEGAGKAIAFSVLAFLLGSASIVEGAEFKKGMLHLVKDKQVEQGKVTITKSELKWVIQQAKKKSPMIGKWREDYAINIVARTLYMEARGEGDAGLKMVMTVIWNRAGGDKEFFADECLRPLQFSCWNKLSNKTPSTYSIQFPKGVKDGNSQDMSSWSVCQDFAKSMFNGTFKPVNTRWNAYYNPNKANPDWADELQNAETVGHHLVGTLKDQIQHAKNLAKAKAKKQGAGNKVQVAQVKTKDHKVQDGESLWTISGKNMDKVNQIKAINGLKSDVIRPGQVLKVPA